MAQYNEWNNFQAQSVAGVWFVSLSGHGVCTWTSHYRNDPVITNEDKSAGRMTFFNIATSCRIVLLRPNLEHFMTLCFATEIYPGSALVDGQVRLSDLDFGVSSLVSLSMAQDSGVNIGCSWCCFCSQDSDELYDLQINSQIAATSKHLTPEGGLYQWNQFSVATILWSWSCKTHAYRYLWPAQHMSQILCMCFTTANKTTLNSAISINSRFSNV